MLRQEVYALDGTPTGRAPVHGRPSRTSRSCALQPRGGNRHAVFFAHPREVDQLSLRAQSGRSARRARADARGRRLRQRPAVGRDRLRAPRSPMPTLLPRGPGAADAAARRPAPRTTFTNADRRARRLPRARCRARRGRYELTGLRAGGRAARASRFDEVDRRAGARRRTIAYEATRRRRRCRRRLIEHVRTLYRRDDLSRRRCRSAELESLALPCESYKLAFTPGLLAQVFGDARRPTRCSRPRAATCTARATPTGGCPRAAVFYSPDAGDTPAQELAFARAALLPAAALPRSVRQRHDRRRYDALRPAAESPTRDAARQHRARPSTTTACCSRASSPTPTATAAEVAFDALGMVVGTAVMGKPDEGLGDSLEGFVAGPRRRRPSPRTSRDPLADPHALLQGATTRLVYDLVRLPAHASRRAAAAGRGLHAGARDARRPISAPAS